MNGTNTIRPGCRPYASTISVGKAEAEGVAVAVIRGSDDGDVPADVEIGGAALLALSR